MLRRNMIHEWRRQFPVHGAGVHVLCSGQGAPARLPDLAVDESFPFAFLCTHEHGMVYIHADNQRAVVTWDLQRCHYQALEQAREWLEDNHAGQVILRFRYAGLRIEKHNSMAVAVERMGKLNWYRDIPNGERIVIAGNAENFSNTTAIKRGLEIADSAKNINEMSALLPYLLIWTQCEKTGNLIREHVGKKSGATLFWGDDWQRAAVGREYEWSDPGEHYPERVAENYLRVLDTGDPTIDHIYALAFNDIEGGVWLPYQRLLFRTQLLDGRPALACLSDLTSDLEFPILPNPVVNLTQ